MDYVAIAEKLIEEHLTKKDTWDAKARKMTFEQGLGHIIAETIYQIDEDTKNEKVGAVESAIYTVRVSRAGVDALERLGTPEALKFLEFLRPQQAVWEAGVSLIEKIDAMPAKAVAASVTSLDAMQDAIEAVAMVAKKKLN